MKISSAILSYYLFALAFSLPASAQQDIGRYPLNAAQQQPMPAVEIAQDSFQNPYMSESIGGQWQTSSNDLSIYPLPSLNSQSYPLASAEYCSPGQSDETFFASEVSPDFQFSTSLELPLVEPTFVTRAMHDGDGAALIAPYQARPSTQAVDSEPRSGEAADSNFQPWWTQSVSSELGVRERNRSICLNSLIESALRHSPHIQVAATEPHIRQSSVFEEASQFDWTTFMETKYADANDPIGNTLTTGNNENRFKQQEWYGRAGMRRKNVFGGEAEIVQRLGYLDNNSRFLIPPKQGTSRLELNYRQPLLKGKGIAVNEGLVLLAEIDFRSASDQFLEELQQHLADVTQTYWELVRARSEYLQRRKLLDSATAILQKLEGRSEVDALDRQIYRAKAAVANRQAEIARSATSIRNAESKLRLLVNDPELINASGFEFIPADVPSFNQLTFNVADAISTALVHRPDISKAIRDVKAANVRNGVAKNEILPKLDLIVGTYAAGLDGDSDALNSWVNQFRDGRPGFNVGFEFEFPVGNRTAKARQQRRQWEVNRALHQFRAVTETALTEVEIAVREVNTARQELLGRYHSMVAANNESGFLIDRWQTLPDVNDSVTLLLEDLLDSQERLADEEASYARAQFDYAVSTVRLKQAMGTLFQVEL